ncbi:MAG: DNA/RNA non-specific endonuclease [Lachnospiraceae bacterium]|nr:DNA/RNA non-specific endonuclease [Lachnospiraceae bacterium]
MKLPPLIVLVLTVALLTAQSVFNLPVLDTILPVLEQISTGELPEPDSIFTDSPETVDTVYLEDIPEYFGEPYVQINGNVPDFTKEEETLVSFEYYSPLDELGRCGVAYANIGQDLMPTEERGSISSVKPAGWHSVRYDNVEGKSLYNRCHLIGFQLTGENANEQNLITGTRYLNVEGMLPFENMVAEYVRETNNHVLYRVTPVYEGENLIADGLLMEAKSVEDHGAGVCFFIYAYNVQPGIQIDYLTGESSLIQ